MQAWLEVHKPVDLATYVAALTEREALLSRWMTFMQQWPLVIFRPSATCAQTSGRHHAGGAARGVWSRCDRLW